MAERVVPPAGNSLDVDEHWSWTPIVLGIGVTCLLVLGMVLLMPHLDFLFPVGSPSPSGGAPSLAQPAAPVHLPLLKLVVFLWLANALIALVLGYVADAIILVIITILWMALTP